jgi:hypothetical protein
MIAQNVALHREASVTEVALEYGFTHLGRFSGNLHRSAHIAHV